KAVPEDKYAWRPGAGVRSFAEVFLHIAHGNRLLLSIATAPMSKEALEKKIKETLDGEKEAANKERILQLLGESFAAVRKSLEGLRAGALGSNAEFFGQATTRRGVFVSLDTHIAEHLGQAIAYARMNGIKPPWSQ
ncbi:MAG: DinB family protein, partial [Bryobacteraceae bacterium]